MSSHSQWSVTLPNFFKASVYALALCIGQLQAGHAQTAKIVAIGQIAEGYDLDDVRRGVLDAIKKNGFADAKIVYENAQNDLATAVQIGQRFIGMSPDVIIPIGTPVAQAIVRSTKTIPVVFAGIGDPLGAGLVSNMERPGGNVTGTRAFTVPEAQLDLIKAVLPNAKRIGVLYNPAEAQSRTNVDAFTKVATQRGLEAVLQTVNSSSETYTAAAGLVGKVDAIWVPPDSTLTTSFESVLKVAVSSRTPLFTTAAVGVKAGAIGAQGLDWYQIGYEAGEFAARVLKGEKPGDIGVTVASKTSLLLNPGGARKFGIELPPELIAKAAKIFE